MSSSQPTSTRLLLGALAGVALCGALAGCAEDKALPAGPVDDADVLSDPRDERDAGDTGPEDDATPGCVDRDGDGVAGTGVSCNPSSVTFDCADDNADIFPGALERCNGIDDDCDGQVDEGAANLCGGCEALQPNVGQICGQCNRVVCDGDESTRCDETLTGNACGGCGELAAVPGQACGQCGVYVCSGINRVECEDSGFDACGGCSGIDFVLDGLCGDCGDGAWTCEGRAPRCAGGTERSRFYLDADGDGVGLEGSHRESCAAEAPYTATETGDCDDSHPLISPTQTETCNGFDDNCNGVIDEDSENLCGGCRALLAAPGDQCGGDCGSGLWACASGEQLICNGEGVNPCGGCTELDGTPGVQCGECGETACTGPDEIVCDDPGRNACGGCVRLDHPSDTPCGVCGQWTCQDVDEVVCEDPGPNACGGCEVLGGTLGVSCGDCGSRVCAGLNALTCSDPGPNSCGGCDGLSQQVGTSCGVCGTWVCDGGNDVRCDDPGLNSCGGCAVLPGEPGQACGPCGDYVCNGSNEVTCTSDNVNACGGCTTLNPPRGSSCGLCGSTICDGPEAVQCSDLGLNPCGGCAVLPNQPGSACGTCGTWVCNGADAVSCSDPGANACGGCGTLSGSAGDPCGACGTLECSGGGLVCDDPGTNPCLGCTPLPDYGSACGQCGTRICSGLNATLCDDPGSVRYWHDGDGDTYGSPAYQDLCGPSGNYTARREGDCNDSEAAMFPGNPEICDGLDNDCAGTADDDPVSLCTSPKLCISGACSCVFDECYGGCCGFGQRCCEENICVGTAQMCP